MSSGMYYELRRHMDNLGKPSTDPRKASLVSGVELSLAITVSTQRNFDLLKKMGIQPGSPVRLKRTGRILFVNSITEHGRVRLMSKDGEKCGICSAHDIEIASS